MNMRWQGFLLIFLTFFIILLLFVYFFIPLNTIQLKSPVYGGNSSGNSNFSINSSFVGMQFYPNMRYESREISYKISDACPLKKKNDMQEAFDIISNITVLQFYPVIYGEEISVSCSNDNIVEGNAFVGGEGGVTNVTIAGNYNLISKGEILLLRDSDCPRPNIAIHELLHALGFAHSQNQNNIMYPTSDCDQTVGDDIPFLINQLYSVNPEPDLTFDNISAIMHGKYLDVNISLRNVGLADASSSVIEISADGKEIKKIDVSPLQTGYGDILTITNLWINKITVNELEFTILTNDTELDKSNNVAIFSLK